MSFLPSFYVRTLVSPASFLFLLSKRQRHFEGCFETLNITKKHWEWTEGTRLNGFFFVCTRTGICGITSAFVASQSWALRTRVILSRQLSGENCPRKTLQAFFPVAYLTKLSPLEQFKRFKKSISHIFAGLQSVKDFFTHSRIFPDCLEGRKKFNCSHTIF